MQGCVIGKKSSNTLCIFGGDGSSLPCLPQLGLCEFFSLMEVNYLLSGLLGPILSTTTIIWSTAKEDAADAHNVWKYRKKTVGNEMAITNACIWYYTSTFI